MLQSPLLTGSFWENVHIKRRSVARRVNRSGAARRLPGKLAGQARAAFPCALTTTELMYGGQGKPAFSTGTPLWFNLSHSGDNILLLSDEDEIGCDIEMIRTRDNWRSLTNAVFSLGKHAEMEAERPERQLAAFWRIWTRKAAI